jgi:hypothetical protein
MNEKKTGNTDAVTNWICPKCGEVVYISEKVHAVVCYLYQDKDNDDDKDKGERSGIKN